jgi:hypothetical protein
MNTWNKVFLGIIFVSAIAVVILAAPEAVIRQTGIKRTAQYRKDIEAVDEKNLKLEIGTAPTKPTADKPLNDMSMSELRGLERARFDERGRAWFNCIASRVGISKSEDPPPPQVRAQVIITGPLDANGIETDAAEPKTLQGVVYVFEEAAAGQEGGEEGEEAKIVAPGVFLGRFQVDPNLTTTKFKDKEDNEKTGYRVTLITADPIGKTEVARIENAGNSRWAIYTTPPVDRIAGVLSLLTEEEMQMLPEELRVKLQPRPMPELTEEELEGVDSNVAEKWKQYRQEWDDPESDSAQSFALLLDWLYQRRVRINREIATTTANIATFEAAAEKNTAENEQLKNDGIYEEKRVEVMNTQRDAVKSVGEQYDMKIDEMNADSVRLQKMIAAYTTAITEAQLRVAEKIEERTKNAGQRQEEIR